MIRTTSMPGLSKTNNSAEEEPSSVQSPPECRRDRGPEEDMVTGITQSAVAGEVEMGQEPVSTQSRDEKQTKTQGQQFLTD